MPFIELNVLNNAADPIIGIDLGTTNSVVAVLEAGQPKVIQNAEGHPPLTALLNSGTNRLMPVAMAALTTALGMIPLIFDAFFVSMAVTIIFGLMCATVLTMLVLPVFYAILYKVPYRDE